MVTGTRGPRIDGKALIPPCSSVFTSPQWPRELGKSLLGLTAPLMKFRFSPYFPYPIRLPGTDGDGRY